ncbi:MAG: MBL fold metallo-hydrolase [Anaerolineaceae bacterium]|nr:MBL fold metallo-hydrolase [Anaerolineaceae bacterium]
MNNNSIYHAVVKISSNLYLYKNTCHVYIICQGESAVLIDFGDGSVLEFLEDLGIKEVTAVLMTHHHRDQAQGLQKAVDAGIPIWVPEIEQDLFSQVDWHWQARNILNNYNVREDRFSLLHSVLVSGLLRDYEHYDFSGINIEVVPTPGHTPGSISLIARIDGKQTCFVGDLIAGPGKLWSLAATQWTYNGAEGVVYSILSLLKLKREGVELLLPSHGEIIENTEAAIDLLIARLYSLLLDRGEFKNLLKKTENPFLQITPHVYRNVTSEANSYVIISDSGKAMIIDYGYDFVGGMAAGTDRASRRPWLYTISILKENYGVQTIDVVLPTHYHDDHVAGINLLQRVEGASVWAPENFADILKHPHDYNLPCLWYDPIEPDEILPLEKTIQWEEFKITCYPLPGHTRYAVAILLAADDKRILFSGDHYQGEEGLIWNYVYQNRYDLYDYLETADLYQKINPDIILSGHWSALNVKEGYFQKIKERAEKLVEHHRNILMLESENPGIEGFIARISPYQVQKKPGESVHYQCEIMNPMDSGQLIKTSLVLPEGWEAIPARIEKIVKAHQKVTLDFHVQIPDGQEPSRRIRIALEVTVGTRLFGQQAEALITIA